MTELLAFIIGICAGVGLAYGYYRYRIWRQELDAAIWKYHWTQLYSAMENMKPLPDEPTKEEMKEAWKSAKEVL